MRPYNRCISRGVEYRTSIRSDKYGEYIRVSHSYSLVVTPQEFTDYTEHILVPTTSLLLPLSYPDLPKAHLGTRYSLVQDQVRQPLT